MKFTHLINPFRAEPGSAHAIARPAVFASVRSALLKAAEAGLEIEVLAAAFPEDKYSVEPPARLAGELKRSVQDVRRMRPVRRLPLFSDVLSVAHAFGAGSHVIYTNMDISLAPVFYTTVADLIGKEPSAALAIKSWDLERTGGENGGAGEGLVAGAVMHGGFDCFVFPRDWVPTFELGAVCLGARWADALLMANLDVRSEYHARVVRDARISFHHGPACHPAEQVAYEEHNLAEALRAMSKLRAMKRPQEDCQFAGIHRLMADEAGFSKRFARTLRRLNPRRLMPRGTTEPTRAAA